MAYQKQTLGVYQVPTDWTITILYEVEKLSGKIKLETWVDKYVRADQSFV
jgi:hypothetical protein